MKNYSILLKLFPYILLLSTPLLILALFGALTLINISENIELTQDELIKSIIISLVVGIIHLIWWSIFFIIKKKQMKNN